MTSFCIVLLAIGVIAVNISLFLVGNKVEKLNEDLEKLWDANVVNDSKMKQIEFNQDNLHERFKILAQQDGRLLNYINIVNNKLDWIEKDREIFNGGA